MSKNQGEPNKIKVDVKCQQPWTAVFLRLMNKEQLANKH